jgi:hypothetical protein
MSARRADRLRAAHPHLPVPDDPFWSNLRSRQRFAGQRLDRIPPEGSNMQRHHLKITTCQSDALEASSVTGSEPRPGRRHNSSAPASQGQTAVRDRKIALPG